MPDTLAPFALSGGHTTNFYRRFPGDYGRDTTDLNFEQHGAYTLLLDIAYTTEKPLPSDRELIYRMTRAISASERAAVDFVIDRYFVNTRWGFTHKRVSEEITNAESRREHASKAINQRWQQRKLPDTPSITLSNPQGNTPAIQFQTPDSRQNLKTPLPPAKAGGLPPKVSPGGSRNGLQYIERYGVLIEVHMGRHQRLPNLESTVGQGAEYLIDWLASKGFTARILDKESL